MRKLFFLFLSIIIITTCFAENNTEMNQENLNQYIISKNYIFNNDLENSYKILTELYDNNNNNNLIINQLLNVCISLGQNTDINPPIVETLKKIEKNSDNFFVYHLLYTAYINSGDKKQALKYLTKKSKIISTVKEQLTIIELDKEINGKYKKELIKELFKFKNWKAYKEIILLGEKINETQPELAYYLGKKLVKYHIRLDADIVLTKAMLKLNKKNKFIDFCKKNIKNRKLSNEASRLFLKEAPKEELKNLNLSDWVYLITNNNYDFVVIDEIFKLIDNKVLASKTVYNIFCLLENVSILNNLNNSHYFLFIESLMNYEENEKALTFFNKLENQMIIIDFINYQILNMTNTNEYDKIKKRTTFLIDNYSKNIEKKTMDIINIYLNNNIFHKMEFKEITKNINFEDYDNSIEKKLSLLAVYCQDYNSFLNLIDEENNLKILIETINSNKIIPFDKKELSMLINKNPTMNNVLLYADLLKKRNMQKEAIDLLKSNLNDFSYKADYLNYLGYLMIENNDNLLEAKELLERAINIKPDSDAIWDSLAWCYFLLNLYDKAYEAIKNVNIDEMKDSELSYHYAEILLKKHLKEEAIIQLKNSISYNTNLKYTELAKNKLKLIEDKNE